MAIAKKPVRMSTATSFKGVFVFPKLNAPDFGSKDYPVHDGQYVVRLKGEKSDPAVASWIKQVEAELAKAETAAKERFAALKVAQRKALQDANGPAGIKANPVYKVLYDEETEEETGEIEVKFQMPAKITIKNGPRKGQVMTFKPIIVDARGIAIPQSKLPQIDGGSTGIISYEFVPGGYFVEGSGRYGVKLRMVAVQLLSVKTFGERTAASLGFTAQEGITADDLEEVEGTEEDTNEDEGEKTDANEDF